MRYLWMIVLILLVSPSEATEVEISGVWTADAAHVVVVNGNYAYIGSNSCIYVLDLSTAHPRTISKYSLDDNFIINGMCLAGNYLYVVDMYMGLTVFDISEPAQLKVRGFYCGPSVGRDIVISGQYAYLAFDRQGVRILDVSDPSLPKEISSIPTNDQVWALALLDNYLFVSNYEDSLMIYDISDPALPKKINSVFNPGVGLGLYLRLPYLYQTIGNCGLQIVDITKPAEAKTIGRCPRSKNLDYVYSWGVQVVDNYAFIADMAGLQIVDISNPKSPKQITYYSLSAVAVDLFVRPTENPNEYLVYITLAFKGLRVLKVRP